jgi:hypothetical protein
MSKSHIQPNLTDQVMNAILSAAGSRPLSLHEPSFKGNKWIYLKECLDSNFANE